MSYLLLGITIASALTSLMYLIMSIRAVTFGGGFDEWGTQLIYTAMIAVGAVLAIWLGPIALAGIGLL